MKTERTIWSVILLAAVLWVGFRAVSGPPGTGYWGEMGKVYAEPKPDGSLATVSLRDYRSAEAAEASAAARENRAARPLRATFNLPRTVGMWMAACFTLALLSFLYRDNPIYKVAESAFVGISAAYWMVVGIWTTLIPNLFGKLFPRLVKQTILPGLDLDAAVEKGVPEIWFDWLFGYEALHGDGLHANWLQLMNVFYLIPLVLGIMLLWRLMPKGPWISRWSLAFVIGYTAGVRLVAHIESDFIVQIASTLQPLALYVYEGTAFSLNQSFYKSFNNLVIFLGTTSGLVYFFFSIEHKGAVGAISRVGIWTLMISFGAGFGYTVMSRVALLVARFEFLTQDWLNVVAPP
ncbi:MAG: hypothetical protein CHACPFDD_02656 [Phycisphaerae bacterium]|nr:hypothetical protein [Phycisphaerae bacterium]